MPDLRSADSELAESFSRVPADEKSPRLALTLGGGYLHDPESMPWVQAGGMVLWDYEDVWRHAAPDPLRFKAEFSAGANTRHSQNLMIAAGIGAVYYIDALRTKRWRPFIEGDIGGIYTAYRVKGQGLHLNFNPQAGIGTEIELSPGRTVFLSLKAHHVSNGGLDDDNRGRNGFALVMGWFF